MTTPNTQPTSFSAANYEAQVQEALSTLNNVAREFHIRMVARKAQP